MILLALISAPLLTEFIDEAVKKFLQNFKNSLSFYRRVLVFFGCLGLLFASLLNGLTVRLPADIWADTAVLGHYKIPMAAVRFLAHETNTGPKTIFNYFDWGGYIIWTLPEDKIFLDGRGTATWRRSISKTLLEEYFDIVYQPGGIEKLNAEPARYVLLPDAPTEPQELKNELDASPDWKRIYSDDVSVIWKRIGFSTPLEQ